MNETNKKILYLIEENKHFRENLFFYSTKQIDISFHNDEYGDDYDIEWLYTSKDEFMPLIGIDLRTNEVFTVNENGFLDFFCFGLENIPYEVIRRQCKTTPNKTVKEYFNKNEFFNIEIILQNYQKWCKDNRIILDNKKTYHDNNGNLFNKYFDLV